MPKMDRKALSIALFYSYSHRDEAFREELEKHLSLLKRRGVITDWSDRKIGAGTEWKDSIDPRVELAQIILLMVSADFIASDYCYDVELKRAMERHEKGEARIVPVILRPCDWADAPFGKLQALPKDARPVTKWPNQDEAWLDVVRGIRSTCDEIVQRQISSVQIYCDKPPASGQMVWPRCSIAPNPLPPFDGFRQRTWDSPLKWGQSVTILLEPGEYSIHAETGMIFGGIVALADAVVSVAKNETVQYIYRITERPGQNQFDRLLGRLLQVTHL